MTIDDLSDTGLTLNKSIEWLKKYPILSLHTGQTDINDNDYLGFITFGSPDEGTGTDAILDGARIYARAEAEFSASVNKTKLVFQTASSGAAVDRLTITGDGNANLIGYLNAQEDNTHWFYVAATADVDSDAVIDFGHQITKGSAIAESGGRFTVAVAGTYLLTCSMQNASDFDDTMHVYFRKNTTRVGGTIYWEGPTGGQDYASESATIIIPLAANDVVDVYGQGRFSGNSNAEASTTFCGIRLGE